MLSCGGSELEKLPTFSRFSRHIFRQLELLVSHMTKGLKMDIEYLEGLTDFSHMDESEVGEAIRFLLDELNAAKFVNCERCVEKTATRCAQIAVNTFECGNYPYGDAYGINTANNIRKEFNLPKAG